MDDKKEKIQKLKAYFEQREDIVMAFVFGSQAESRAHSGSDWDIAVYFKPEIKPIEWEEHKRDYQSENKVRQDCIDILHTDDVDLIVLNRAPATIADSAIRGDPLVIKNQRLWLEYMLRITMEAEDFRRTTREYAEIYWQAASLTEQAAHGLDRRLTFLDSELTVLPQFANMNWAEYQKNDHKRREAERLIENIINAVIDIAKIILASEKNAPLPETYKETIRRIGVAPPFSSEVTERLAAWAELRNLLTHEYLDYRWKDIEDFLQHGELYIRQFLNDAQTFLKEQRP